MYINTFLKPNYLLEYIKTCFLPKKITNIQEEICVCMHCQSILITTLQRLYSYYEKKTFNLKISNNLLKSKSQ